MGGTQEAGALDIRPAVDADCRAVAEVHVRSWQAAYAAHLDPGYLARLSVDDREAIWRQALAGSDCEVLVAVLGGAVLGFACVGPSRDPGAPAGQGELWALYVDPPAWARGVGRRLWLASEARLRQRGCASTTLWVLEKNDRALRFYAAAGFTPEAGTARTFELGGRQIGELRMRKA